MIRPKHLLALVLVVLLAKSIKSQWKYDDSLKVACRQTGGTFKERESADSITGDTCDLKFKVATADDDDSRDFCELYAPWRLIRVERTKESSGRQFTICHVEATLTCSLGWLQILGHCYKMPDKNNIFTYEDGVEKCKKEKGEIAYIHHRYIIGIWRRYFKGTGQIWVRASESFNQYVQKTKTVDGDTLALAFTGLHYHFSVYPNSLIKVDPKLRLQLLCEYKPPMNAAEINYLGRRYSEIYYPAIPVEHGVLIRSASSYTRSTPNLNVCRGALQPFMPGSVDTFIMDANALEAIDEYRPEFSYLTRSGAVHPFEMSKMSDVMCNMGPASLQVELQAEVEKKSKATNPFLDDFKDTMTCDNMQSVGITQSKTTDAKIQMMSDSRSLPIWCKLGKPIKMTYVTPVNYRAFVRANGEVIAHRMFPDLVMPQKASGVCEDDDALLSGMTSLEEGAFMAEIVVAAGDPSFWGYWIGAERKQGCRGSPYSGGYPYNTDDQSGCSKRKVAVWLNGVASSMEEDFWRLGPNGDPQPDYWGSKSNCIAFVVGDKDYLQKDGPGYLDDVVCDHRSRGVFCQKTVTWTFEA